MLYRIFPSSSEPQVGAAAGGPLFVPRSLQGRGRHDNPDAYGAIYLSRVGTSPVAEVLQALGRRTARPVDLLSEGAPFALARLDESQLPGLIDLDDPRNLQARELRPSKVATRDRDTTQPIARALFDAGLAGFEWWSTIEASWINVTLFAERVVDLLELASEPEVLTIDHPVVQRAADAVGVRLAPR